jgi:hypothetical protein
MLIGVLTQLIIPQLPVIAPRLICFNRWTCGVGEFTESVKIIAPDGSTSLCENKMKWSLKRPEDILTNVHVFGNVEFKEPGIYHVEANVDDVLKLRYPFPVKLVPPNEGQKKTEEGSADN